MMRALQLVVAIRRQQMPSQASAYLHKPASRHISHPHLAGERAVAVQQHAHVLHALLVLAEVLLGAHLRRV
jgi:hypothetical protein